MMLFSERMKHQEAFDEWRLRESREHLKPGEMVKNCLTAAIAWMQSTPEGRGLVERLHAEAHEEPTP